jgi:hypothetical protein
MIDAEALRQTFGELLVSNALVDFFAMRCLGTENADRENRDIHGSMSLQPAFAGIAIRY